MPAAQRRPLTAWLIGAGLLVGALVALLRETPAEWLGGARAAASAQKLVLDGPSGGVLAGAAALRWAPPGQAPVDLGRWRWQLGWPDGLRPSWRLDSVSGPVQGHALLSLGWRSVRLAQLDLRCAAAALPAALGTVALLHPGGELQLSTGQLDISTTGLSGAGHLAWLHARTPLVALDPLGSWTAHWSLHGREGDYRLETTAGPLHVEGSGRMALDGRLGMHGRAWADPGSAGALQPVLQMLGSPQDDGSVAIEWPWPPA